MAEVLKQTTPEGRAIDAMRRASEAMTVSNQALQHAQERLSEIGYMGSHEREKLTDLMLYQQRTHASLAYHMGLAEGAIRRTDTLQRLGKKKR